MTNKTIINLIIAALVITAGFILYNYFQAPTDSYTQDVYYLNQVYSDQVVYTYRNGEVSTTLPGGNKIYWNGSTWQDGEVNQAPTKTN